MAVRYIASLDLTILMNIRCKENMTSSSMRTKSKVIHPVGQVLIKLLKTFSILAITNQSLKKIFIREFNVRMKLRGPFKKIKRDTTLRKIFVKA